MLAITWCCILLLFLALFLVKPVKSTRPRVEKQKASGIQIIWLYYAYAAECAAFGPDGTTYLPHWKPEYQISFIDFIIECLDDTKISRVTGGTTAKEKFRRGYIRNIDLLAPLLDTTKPNVYHAEWFLETCGWFQPGFDNSKLFRNHEALTTFPKIVESVIDGLEAARRFAQVAVEESRYACLDAMWFMWQIYRLRGAVRAIKSLEQAKIKGLKIVTERSALIVEGEPDVQVLDMESTIAASGDMVLDSFNRLIHFWDEDNLDGTSNYKVTVRMRTVSAISRQMVRLWYPGC